jgi:uncharacterized membrane protein
MAWEVLALVVIAILAGGLRLERLGTRGLWQDEAFSLDVARRGIAEIPAYLRENDSHPIGYYALLSLWIRVAGEDLARMRALSMLFGLASLVLLWRLGRRLFSPAVGVVATGLVALNPFQIFASNELRMYMPLEFLVLLSTLALWRARESGRGYGWWVAYGTSVALAAYMSYYALLVVAGHLLWVVALTQQRPSAAQVGSAAAAVVLLFAPWVLYAARAQVLGRGDLLALRGQGMWPTYVPELIAAQTFGGYLFNMLSYHTTQGLPLQFYGVVLLPFVLLIAAGAAALWQINRDAGRLAALCWGAPVAIAVLGSLATGRLLAYAYHLNFVQPFLALFVAAGIVHLRDAVLRASRVLVTLAAVLAVLVFLAPAIDNLQRDSRYQSYRYDSAAAMVKRHYRSGDAVIYLPQGARRGFSFYFDPPGKEIGIPVDPRRWSRASLEGPLREATRSLTSTEPRVWVIFSSPLPEDSIGDLVAAIELRGYRKASVHDFQGVGVALLVRPRP